MRNPSRRVRWAVRGGGAVWLVLGCGPQLADEGLVSGHYRARYLDIDQPDGAVCVPDDEGTGGCLQSGAYEALFAEPVPVRTARNRIDIPEPHQVPVAPFPAGNSVGPINAWKLRTLSKDGSSYTSSAKMWADGPSPWCQAIAWSAVALDEETVFVTREATGCDDTDAGSVLVEIELVLEQACAPPCAFADDRERLAPDLDLGDDVLLGSTRCAC
jgi:hypothetical protein